MSEITNPQDAELEEVVLGACLLESKAIGCRHITAGSILH